MENNFTDQLGQLFTRLGNAKKMVLATSKDNHVTARMMSCVIIDGMIYVQTDKTLIKYEQICANPHVALCVENIQIEGTAAFAGHPLDDGNRTFASVFEQHYKSSFEQYSPLKNEVLVVIRPTKITLWDYENGKPFRVFFDILKQECLKEYYVG